MIGEGAGSDKTQGAPDVLGRLRNPRSGRSGSAGENPFATPNRGPVTRLRPPHLPGSGLCRGGCPRRDCVRDGIEGLAQLLLVLRTWTAIPILVHTWPSGGDLRHRPFHWRSLYWA